MTSPGQQCSGQCAFSRRILRGRAQRLGVTPIEAAGRHDRTIGSAAACGGGRFWLRTTAGHRARTRGEAWTGDSDAAAITDLAAAHIPGRTRREPRHPVCEHAAPASRSRPC